MLSLVRIALVLVLLLAPARSDDAPCDVALGGENDGYYADKLVTCTYMGGDENQKFVPCDVDSCPGPLREPREHGHASECRRTPAHACVTSLWP